MVKVNLNFYLNLNLKQKILINEIQHSENHLCEINPLCFAEKHT